jgi:hypothetical protein
LGTRGADQDFKENTAIVCQVDAEIDDGLQRVGLELDGSTDVVASQRPGLATVSIAAHQSHGEFSKRIALEGFDLRDFTLSQILLSGSPQSTLEVVSEKEG